MKVLYVTTRSELGGAQVHVHNLIKEWNGDAVLLVGEHDKSNSKDYLGSAVEDMGVKVEYIKSLTTSPNLILDGRALKDIVAAVNRHKPDIIHCHSTKAGVLGRLAGWITKTPTIFTAHGWAFTDGASSQRKIFALATELFMAIFTSRIIAVSDYDTNLAHSRGIGLKGKMITIENGIPDHEASFRHGSKEFLRVVMTARFAAPKNQNTLIQAIALVPGTSLALIGDGPLLSAARDLAEKLNITSRVQFLGSRSDVPEILAQSDVFALISNYEGFPLSTLEAMRAGLPVIVSDVGGAAEAVMPGVTGFVVPKDDVQAIATALTILVEQPERRESMGISGRARFLSRYQEKDMVDKTFRVYEEVLAENR